MPPDHLQAAHSKDQRTEAQGLTGPPESSLLSLTSPSAPPGQLPAPVGPGRRVSGALSLSPPPAVARAGRALGQTGGSGGCGGSPCWADTPTPPLKEGGGCPGRPLTWGGPFPRDPVTSQGSGAGRAPRHRGRGESWPAGLCPGSAGCQHLRQRPQQHRGLEQLPAENRATVGSRRLPPRLRLHTWKGSCLAGPQPRHRCSSPGSASGRSGATGLTCCSSVSPLTWGKQHLCLRLLQGRL